MGTRLAERSDGAHAYGISRLRSKTAHEAIVHSIGRDFNLTPLIAEAYFSQIATYFQQHADISLTTGQVCYEAVAAAEPAGSTKPSIRVPSSASSTWRSCSTSAMRWSVATSTSISG